MKPEWVPGRWTVARAALIVAPAVALGLAGCARVALEGGEKPIHIVMDVNVKVDRELDQFFAFEKKYEPNPATQPTTAPATAPVAG